ncbi:unnamed protein product [Lathyrus sativus]|nr:unnamed protein product [Lathyrus sativus]
MSHYKYQTRATKVNRTITAQMHPKQLNRTKTTQTRAIELNRTDTETEIDETDLEDETVLGKNDAIQIEKEFRDAFMKMLGERRAPQKDPVTVEIAKPAPNPCYPNPDEEEIMNACPRKDIPNFKDLLVEENLYLNIEEGDQGKLPLLILSLKETDKQKKRPAVVFNHGSDTSKEYMRPLLEAYASRGYIAISVDARYHGERAKNKDTYIESLVSAWKTGATMPFIFDTVWDLIKLAEYLKNHRQDIDSSRIGITGISLGGMHSWFAAAVDPTYSVVVPIIGVQGFRWAIENDKWQGRVESIKKVFEVASEDLGKSEIDKEVVEKVWDRIAPGLTSIFDSPYSIPSIAPRPLFILNGEEDPRCPRAGVRKLMRNLKRMYIAFGHEKFKYYQEPETVHQITKLQMRKSADWFDHFLKP